MATYKLPSGQRISDQDPNLQEYIGQGAVIEGVAPVVAPVTPAPIATSQAPAGSTQVMNPSELSGLTEEQIYRDPNSQKIYKLGDATQAPASVQQATLTSPTGVREKVDVGSAEASQFLQQGYTLGDKIGGGSMIDNVSMKDEEKINLGNGVPEANSLEADAELGGIKSFQEQVDETLKKTQAPETEKSKSLDDILASLSGDYESAESKAAIQAQAEEEAGISEKQQVVAQKNTELKVKLAQIESLTASFNEGSTKIEGLNILTSGISGKKSQLYREYLARKNSLISESGMIQAELLGLNGELTSAQNMANRMTDLKYSEQEFSINSKIQMLNILAPQVEKEEAEYATAVALVLQRQADDLAEKKAQEQLYTTNAINQMNTYPTAGISITDSPEQVSAKIAALPQTGTDFQFISGTDNQPGGIFDKTAGTFQSFDDLNAQGVVTDASGSSYNILSYATDPNHETAVQSILNNMGQMTSYEQMDSYIQQVAPGSQVTGEMIGNASEQHGVSWESIMAIMQQDSSFGTAGAGARSFNPGNVGNTETATSTGQLVNFGDWQSGVNAVAKNLAWRKVDAGGPAQGAYELNHEFGYNEKVDVNRLPSLGGKTITDKTARTANLPYGITDKQANWIQQQRPGNIEFQKLKTTEYDDLIALFELKDDIDEIRALKENTNTGWLSAKDKRARVFFGQGGKTSAVEGTTLEDFVALDQKTGKQLAKYIKDISGAAVSEQEAQRLALNIPNVQMQDKQFMIALEDYEDDINAVIQGKLNQYDLETEDDFRAIITGAKAGQQTMEDGTVWAVQANGEFIQIK